MLWLLKNTISDLILPPNGILLLLLAALVMWNRRPRASRALAILSFVALSVLSMPAVSTALVAILEKPVLPLNLKAPDLASRGDAIVVLGGGRVWGAREYGRDSVSVGGLERLRYAANLHRATGKPLLLTGGSPGHPGTSEARLMAETLRRDFGIEPKWLEEASENTAQNASFSRKILEAQGIRKVFLVTHAWHMPRAQAAFEKAGFQVVPAPLGYMSDADDGDVGPLAWIPNAAGIGVTYVFCHEALGAVWYRLRGTN